MVLNIGDKAPDFEVNNENSEKTKLSDYEGKKVVLYFYPKDNTPGCNLRDNYQELKAAGYEILGVSPDSEKSHQKFINKYKLPFTLLVDTEKDILQKYDVWKEKSMYGRKYMGTIRTTFIIGEDGRIERIIKKVNTKDHTNQILNPE